MPLIRSMLVSRTFASIYGGIFTFTGYNTIKNSETNKKYPARQVDYWYGSCMPMFEYRSRGASSPDKKK